MSESVEDGRVLTPAELRLIFVGSVVRETMNDLRLGVVGAPGAEFQVGMAEEAFENMMETAAANGIRFVQAKKRVVNCPGSGMPVDFSQFHFVEYASVGADDDDYAGDFACECGERGIRDFTMLRSVPLTLADAIEWAVEHAKTCKLQAGAGSRIR